MFNVIIVSIVDMLTYLSHEMIYPLIPFYLTSILGATPAIVGLIEGISKSVSSLIRFYSGFLSDKRRRKKGFIIFAYFITFFSRMILILSGTWFGVLCYKVSDRFGKGIRVAPMDSLVAEGSTDKGRGFGFNRFFHKLGSSLGVLIAFLLLVNMGRFEFNKIFILSLIPIVIIFVLVGFIHEEKERGFSFVDLKLIGKNLNIFLCIVFLSAIANSTKSFLLLRAESVGFSAVTVVLLYLLFNLSSCLFALPIGRLCDKLSKKNVIGFAYFLFSFIYFCFGLFSSKKLVIFLFFLYGIYIALISVGVKSFITENAPADMKATLCGINDCLVGLGSLPAAIIAGLLWNTFGVSVSFYFSSFISLLSSLLIFMFVKDKCYNRDGDGNEIYSK